MWSNLTKTASNRKLGLRSEQERSPTCCLSNKCLHFGDPYLTLADGLAAYRAAQKTVHLLSRAPRTKTEHHTLQLEHPLTQRTRRETTE